ncbi:Flp pilus assembly protein CpaB [Tabrizicola sp. YIM 78059]|uniref:Flp pilus assembly protein CpaB n=1 Tax=Tabrizicola sp. YIM 78059 TaxID=2529861 RepID=UPI0010AA02C1|nr:Flp pilus assembly protein CpaB [Tabrizicola sp. YIM 78059]
MRITSLLTFVAGLAVAGGSAYMVRDLMETKYAQVEAQACTNDLVKVVIATQDIPFGKVIDAGKLAVIDWPASALPPGAFTDPAALLPAAGTDPRRAKMALAKGDLLLASKVSGFGEKVTIVQSLGPNRRAIAIKVTAETGVGGFVTPGDKVDVILTHGRSEDLKTVTILQNIRVIGVDQDANAETDKPGVARTVTLEVTADEGQRLALAQQAGTLSLALRTIENEDEPVLEAISLRDVLREPEPQDVAAPEEVTVRSVVVRRGVETTEDELR